MFNMSEFFFEDENKMDFNLNKFNGLMEGTSSNGIPGPSFNDFVISTCVPSHIRAARRGVSDWTPVSPTRFVSPSSGFVHDCHPANCTAWVLRFVDGVKICAISGHLLLQDYKSPSPRKREMSFEIEGKRHQDKAIPGSSAYLSEKYGLEDSMQIEGGSNQPTVGLGPRMNQYPWSSH